MKTALCLTQCSYLTRSSKAYTRNREELFWIGSWDPGVDCFVNCNVPWICRHVGVVRVSKNALKHIGGCVLLDR